MFLYENCLQFNVFLFIHQRNEILRDFYGDNKFAFIFKDKGFSQVKYKKTIIKLLPKPYRTDCVDYQTIGYQSKIDCINECLKDHYIREYKGFYPSFFYDSQYDGYFIENWLKIEKNCLAKIFSYRKMWAILWLQ